MIPRTECAICDGNMNHIYDIPDVPLRPIGVDEFPKKYPLSFGQCETCNTIQLDQLVPLEILYQDSHNYVSIGPTWNEYFDTMIDKYVSVFTFYQT